MIVLSVMSGSLRQITAQEVINIGEVFTIHSEVLNEEREYRVLLPDKYNGQSSQYPVIYVLDGASYFLSAYSAVKALSGLDYMPRSIVVAVSNADRTRDLTPPDMDIPGVAGGRGDRFLRFLADELVPAIDRKYSTLPLRVLIGHSHGGIFGLYTLAKRPDAFRWQIALDAPVHLDNAYLEKGLENALSSKQPLTGRLVVGWNRYSWSEASWQKLEAAVDKGFRAMEIELPGESHSSMYYPGMYYGLKHLFADHAYRHKEILDFQTLETRYKAMNAEYGYQMKIPRWALMYGALEHLVAAEADKALPFIERLEKDYGNSIVLGDDGREWLAQLQSNPPVESRAQYLARPDASFEEIGPFLGKWSDDSYTIEITTNGHKPLAMITQTFPDGSLVQNKSPKLIMNKGLLEIVQPNGMAPLSGLILYRCSPPESDVLSVHTDFKVYWPRMESRKHQQVLRLVKKK